MTRTALASKTKLNYSVLTRYIKLLGILGWVEVSLKVQKGLRISSVGRDFLHAFTRYEGETVDHTKKRQENLDLVYTE